MQHELQGNWNYPSDMRAGAGFVAQLAACCKDLGISRPLLITDPGLAGLAMVNNALVQCRAQGIAVELFSNIKGNPTGENVADGLAAFNNGGHNGIIAFGGGSAMDAGKAIALMVGQKRPLWDFEDEGDNWQRVNESGVAPVIAIPTTAGTGSEVGRAAVITDTTCQKKRIIFHPKIQPQIVILDPELTVSLPSTITAATGMDALSHNLEALCSPFYHPMADGIAIEGIRLVKENLPAAVANGNDINTRMQMLVASAMGATAFQKGLGAMHALAHPLGALYDAHHGLLNAILMPYVLEANRDQIAPKLSRLARYLELDTPEYDSFQSWVLQLRASIGIPHSLAEIGIDDAEGDRVGQMACEDPSAGGNPVRFSAGEYARIFSRAVNGDL
ncbi:MAG: iron-containing alcohol dehydrogenase [Oceanicoccus sp.]